MTTDEQVLSEALDRLVGSLPKKYAMVLHLRLQGKSLAQCAKELRVTKGRFRNLFAKAKALIVSDRPELLAALGDRFRAK